MLLLAVNIIEVLDNDFKKSIGEKVKFAIGAIEWGYSQPMNGNKTADRDRAYISWGNDIKETRRETDKK